MIDPPAAPPVAFLVADTLPLKRSISHLRILLYRVMRLNLFLA